MTKSPTPVCVGCRECPTANCGLGQFLWAESGVSRIGRASLLAYSNFVESRPAKGIFGIALGVCLGTVIINRLIFGEIDWSKVMMTTAIAGAMSWWFVVRKRKSDSQSQQG